MVYGRERKSFYIDIFKYRLDLRAILAAINEPSMNIFHLFVNTKKKN